MEIRTQAAPATVAADRQRRTITGLVVPWGTFARVSTGQNVGFERGSLTLSPRSKLVLDHDPAQPVAVYQSSSDTEAGLEATFRVPAGPRGDDILAEASEGLRDGLSVSADLDASTERDDGSLWVTAARGRHVALLSEPAFDAARVSTVTAAPPPPTLRGDAVSYVEATAPTPEPQPEPEPEPAVTLTAAGAAVPSRPVVAARVRDPYPYAQPLELGGPHSLVRDAWAAMETPGSDGADRWRRAQAMAADPAYYQSAIARFAAPSGQVMAAPGSSVNDPALTPVRWLPDRYVPLIAPKAPLYTALTKFATPDFNTLELPKTAIGGETGLSGTPADELTPIAPGNIATGNDTVTIAEVEGAYEFSRRLLMGSNPAIDRIALDALDRAWLADVEARAVTFFTTAANSTPWGATYADGVGFITGLRAAMASMAAQTVYTATVAIPSSKEYIAAAEANGTDGHALLPQPPYFNAAGSSGPAFTSLSVQGVPLMPGPYMSANHTLLLDQDRNSACVFATPVMNFRLEWTTDVATGGNVKVLKLVKYSGVGFWSQHPGGVVLITNSTPLAADEADAAAGSGRARK